VIDKSLGDWEEPAWNVNHEIVGKDCSVNARLLSTKPGIFGSLFRLADHRRHVEQK
jgi:hypothetical protein